MKFTYGKNWSSELSSLRKASKHSDGFKGMKYNIPDRI